MALVAPDGSWLKVNRSLCTFTGYSEEELLRLRFQGITHPEDLDLDSVSPSGNQAALP
jgi:PAS domain S-box-containing protein